MVRKRKADAGKRGDSTQLADAVRDSAQQIWLAGLGAFAKARADRDKLFDVLVKEGRALQARTKAIAEDRIGEVTERVSEVREKVGKQATDSWDRLEQVFEERVSRALGRLGVPSRREIEELLRRVDDLAASVVPAPRKAEARKLASGAARKAAAKPAKSAGKPASRRSKRPAAESAAAAKTPAKRAARKPAVAPTPAAVAAKPD